MIDLVEKKLPLRERGVLQHPSTPPKSSPAVEHVSGTFTLLIYFWIQ